jgi:glycosyltransferase involved in cell wall biosynthesis
MNSSNNIKKTINVLMIGPDRLVRGGISSVVNSYYDSGLNEKINLKYVSTMKDGNKIKKLNIALKAYSKYSQVINNYDIVHIHMSSNMSYFRKSFFVKKAFKKNKKIIIHQHSGGFIDFYNKSNKKQKKKIREIFSMANIVIVLSEKLAQFFKYQVCCGDKVMILYNGVMIPSYRKKEYKNNNVLFLGRITKDKGIFDLLDSIKCVIKKIPNAQFYLAGDGEDFDKCKVMIKEKSIEDCVHLIGWIDQSEKEEYLKKCSVFVLPSYYEAFPMSLLEAMSFGLAPISTNVGGVGKIITNGVNGIFIEIGNSNNIANNLIKVLNGDDFKQFLGFGAYNKVTENFNIKIVTSELIEVYESLLNNVSS